MTETATHILSETAGAGSTVPRYELDEWRREFGVIAGITGRQRDFALSPRRGSPTRSVQSRWQALQEMFGPAFQGVVVSRQIHGTALGTYESLPGGVAVRQGLDGHATRAAGVLLAVTVADCVPIYLLHPVSCALALLHAGWRGMAAGILDAGVEKLCELADARPQDLVMHCGVSICGSCYEVGPEVHEALRGQRPERPETLDLREILISRAQELGIRRLTVSPWCAAHDHRLFYSHRASGGRAGRMAAYLGCPAA